jgi:uncharacterized protein (TIGR02217 family)
MALTFTPPFMPGLSPAYTLNPNPVFADYPGAPGAAALPTSWAVWSGSVPTKAAYGSSQSAPSVTGAAGSDGGLQISIPGFSGPGWYVLEATVFLAAGALTAAGVYCDGFTDATLATPTGDVGSINFAAAPDVGGVVHGAGTAGTTYSFRGLVQFKLAASKAAVLYAMAHWSAFGSETAANQIIFQQCSIRPATFAEIAAGNSQYGLPVFPILPGQAITVSKAPKWSTKVKRASSGRERRTALWAYPLWQFELSFEVVRHRPTNDELAALWTFYNTVQGQYGPWLFLDPTDCQNYDPLGAAPEIASSFGVGDGATATFQLQRYLAAATPAGSTGILEPVYAPFGLQIFVNGTPTTAYTPAPGGRLTFTTPPAAGAALTWTGYFYFGCRFLEDELTLEQFAAQLWSGKSLKFTSLRV